MFEYLGSRFRPILLALGLLSLAGCYSTEMPVITKGENAPLEGTFQCENSIAGGVETMTYTESKSGFVRPDYAYFDQDGAETKLVEMADGLRLIQQQSENGGYNYGFLDFIDSDRFILSVADVMSKGPYIEGLAEKSGITTSSGREPGEVVLDGDEGDILEFLTAHDKSMLSAFMSCKRL